MATREQEFSSFFISILQFNRGKTNNDTKLFGQSCRHINPNMCSVGAQGFYLMYQFNISKEMELPPYFCHKSSWFNMKLLTDANSIDPKKGITQKIYSTSVGRFCAKMEIDARHLAHI